MLKRVVTFFFISSASLFAQTKGNFFQTEAEIGLERSLLNGHIHIGNDTNSTLSLKDDLGITHQTAGLQAIFTRLTTHHKFGFKMEKYSHSGSKKLSTNIIYNGSQYATASLVNSKVALRWAKAKYRYRFDETLSIGADINGFELKAIVNEDESKKRLILPAIGFDYEKMIEEGLNLIAKASATLLTTSKYAYGYLGFSYDLKLLHCTCLHMGYQYKHLDINENTFKADLKYQGLYVGLGMKF